MADNMSYLYTIGGYATLFGIGFVVYQLSTQKDRKRAAAAPAKAAKAVASEPRKEDKKKKQRMASFSSEAQEASKKAAKTKAAEKTPEESAWLSNAASGPDDNVDNREFARQLAKAKEGTKFANKSEGGKQKEKSVKQSRANIEAVAAELPKESVPAPIDDGADADEEPSPISSPEVGPATAGDVSDMLEPARAAPKVLRLTDTEPKKQQPKKAKAAEVVESKKQRQNRKKAEASKAAREEAEKERKALEEKQRRTARVAEGRAAKDGSQFTNAAVAKSSWTQGAPASTKPAAGQAPATNGFHQPLDTFEQPPAAAATASKPAQSGWTASLPSEEEQLELLKEDDDAWSTVKTKASKKAAKSGSPADSGDEPTQARPAAQPQAAPVRAEAKSTPSFGSFSALQSKDEPAEEDEEEEEEEWEV